MCVCCLLKKKEVKCWSLVANFTSRFYFLQKCRCNANETSASFCFTPPPSLLLLLLLLLLTLLLLTLLLLLSIGPTLHLFSVDLNILLFLLPSLVRSRFSEEEEDCSVLLCLSVKLWDGHNYCYYYYYYYYYYDYNDELSCCCCYIKTGPSAIDLKPQQSRALASRSAPRETRPTDRPNATKQKQHKDSQEGRLSDVVGSRVSSLSLSLSDWLVGFFVFAS